MAAEMSRLLASADSHVIEPSDVWDRVDTRFRDRAPRSEQGGDGGMFFVGEGTAPRRVTHVFGAGTTETERCEQADGGLALEWRSRNAWMHETTAAGMALKPDAADQLGLFAAVVRHELRADPTFLDG